MLRLRSSLVRSVLVAAVLGASTLLAACGGSASTPAAVASDAPSGIEKKSAVEISNAAHAAALAASSVHIKGKSTAVELDLRIGKDGAIGTVGLGGGTVGLLRVGTSYWIKADAAFWKKSGVPDAAAGRLANKYVDASDQSAQFKNLSSVAAFFASSSKSANATKGDQIAINGMPTITIKDSDGSLLFVALNGQPLPLRITNGGTDGGQFDLTDWNVPVDVKAPSPDEIVDVKKALTG